MASPPASVAPSPPRLVLLCGPAFSGKSTLALRLQDELGFEIASPDRVHIEKGHTPPFTDEQWALVNREAWSFAEEHLRAGRSVVYDDTSCYRFLRDGARDVAQRLEVRFSLVVLRLTPEQVMARAHRNREAPTRHDVIDEVLLPHLARFEWPDVDEEAMDFDGSQGAEALFAELRKRLS